MMDVMIGVDPHKGSHTATMLDRTERELTRIKVRAGRRQVAELLEWANGHETRTWAVEAPGGMGRRCRRDGAERAGNVGVTGARVEHRASRPRPIRTMPVDRTPTANWRVLSGGSSSEEQLTVARGSRRLRTRDDGAVHTGAVLTVVVGVGVGILPTAAAGH